MKKRSRRSSSACRRASSKGPGCGVAFALVALVFAGVIGATWLAVVALVYVLRRAWKAARSRPVERPAESEAIEARAAEPRPTPAQDDIPAAAADADADATLQQLDRLVAQARPHLPDELVVHLYSVRCSIAQALPWLVHGASHEADLYTVRETVRRYLPDTLAHYFALPPAVRTVAPAHGDASARELLGEQLALLDAEMRAIASKVAAHDVQALRANGRFLEARFGRPDLVSG